MSKKPAPAPEFDDELGPVLDDDGQAVPNADDGDPRLVIEFRNPATGRNYRAKIDREKILAYMRENHGIAVLRIAQKVGFTDDELKAELKGIENDDPRAEKIIALQNESVAVRRAQAVAAVAAFVAWNCPQEPPTVQDLVEKGGNYDAYLEAFSKVFLATGNPSAEATETT